MNSPLEKVKAQADVIFFDAAGTLIHLKEPVGRHYAEIARRHGLEANEERLNKAFREEWQNQSLRKPSPGPREEDDRLWWKSIAIKTLQRTAVISTKVDLEAWFEELYLHFTQPGVWALYEDATRCLERMEGNSRLAVISNFDRRLRIILEQLNVTCFFEHLFISSEIGCEKPHPRIFLRALETMSVDPARCLHVGDDALADQKGAREVGMQTLLLNRPNVTLDILGP